MVPLTGVELPYNRLLLAAALTLSACGTQQNTPPVTEAPDTSATVTEASEPTETAETEETAETTVETTADETAAEEKPQMQSEQPSWYADEGLVGAPWPISILDGNITAERPARNDDFYMYYNYDFLKENAGNKNIVENEDSQYNTIKRSIIKLIEDETKTGHDLEQLRIMYSMVGDRDYVNSLGTSEIMPYIEMIRAVSSLEEMNELLESTDFPFSPFIMTILCSADDVSPIGVSLFPNYYFGSAYYTPGKYFSTPDDPSSKEWIDSFYWTQYFIIQGDRQVLGITEDEVEAVTKELMEFESSYVKYDVDEVVDIETEYGEYARSTVIRSLTLDEVADLCPAFPIKGILAKQMKDTASGYYISPTEWLVALNDLWTEDNLEIIKLFTQASILNETYPLRDLSEYSDSVFRSGQPKPRLEDVSYDFCIGPNTFSHLVAELYVSEVLGESAVTRITNLALDLRDTYKMLIQETEWLEAQPREKIIKKLDTMKFDVLGSLSNGYDFSGLDLIPMDKGGTPISNYLMIRLHINEQENNILNENQTRLLSWFYSNPINCEAGYYLKNNAIVISPGYVYENNYRDDMSEEELLGSIGFAIAHEMSHAFDYGGSQLNYEGRPETIFTGKDIDNYMQKNQMLADYYSSIEALPGMYLNGDIVVGEAFSDLSAVQAVLTLAMKSGDFDLDKLLSAFCRIFRTVRQENVVLMYFTDSHALENYRINVSAQMFDVVYEKFGIKEGDGMYLAPEKRIVIWGKDAS